jgi:RNA-directed DNA polymerase
MARTHSDLPWCRYADDGLVHCRTEQEAETIKVELQARLAECKLEMHPTKTKIVYCQDGKRKGKYPNTKFDFLGYCFRPRLVSTRNGRLFWGFNPAVSDSALNDMRAAIRDLHILHQTQLSVVSGGYRAADQSTPAGVDWILRAVYPLGTVSLAQVRKSKAPGLGEAEVQEI